MLRSAAAVAVAVASGGDVVVVLVVVVVVAAAAAAVVAVLVAVVAAVAVAAAPVAAVAAAVECNMTGGWFFGGNVGAVRKRAERVEVQLVVCARWGGLLLLLKGGLWVRELLLLFCCRVCVCVCV